MAICRPSTNALATFFNAAAYMRVKVGRDTSIINEAW